MSILLYLILFMLIYRLFTKYINLSKIRNHKSKKGIEYQDAEFREID